MLFFFLSSSFHSFIHSPVFSGHFVATKMSSGILWGDMCLLLLIVCASILWFFYDHVKKRRRLCKKIFICGDCWLEVFDFLAPSQLGLEIALVNRRFDFIIDEHFKTRKWTLGKELLITWKICRKSGPKQMHICDADKGKALPIPQNSLPTKVIGFSKCIQINYIDQNVVAFLRRFRRLFGTCATALNITTENVRILDYFLRNIWPMFCGSMHFMFLNATIFRRMRQFAPSLLSNCPSLFGVAVSNNDIVPAFPLDDSANASDGQAVAKWLLTPHPNGVPKRLKCSVNSMEEEQWTSMIGQFKAAFSNASSPATFRIHFPSSSPLDFIVPFDLINEVTEEKLTLEEYDNGFWLDRCPIGWDEIKWQNAKDEMFDRTNSIDIWIEDGGYDDGLLLDASSPGAE